MRVTSAIVILVFAVTGSARGQAERYELGLRLRALEANWEKADADGRERALAKLKPVSRQFLTFQFGEAARTLDEANFALDRNTPSDVQKWFQSLQVVPAKRLIDATVAEITVEVKSLYKVAVRPQGVRVTVGDSPGVVCDKLPLKIALPLPPGVVGDSAIPLVVECENQRYQRHGFSLSRVADLANRIQKMPGAGGANSLERATVIDRAKLFAELAAGESPESDLPVCQLLAEAETWANGEEYFTAKRSGRYWMTGVTDDGERTPCRVSVPRNLDGSNSVPLVVALHGAGGSENLFFDGYGAGCVVKESEKRGWITVAPRSTFGFLGGPPPIAGLIKTIAERYPVDPKRVFLIGHSMGAAQAVESVQNYPGAFAAVAALGGAGRVKNAAAFANVPVFVGVGAEDFARNGAKSLHESLRKAGVRNVTFKEYPRVEHLTIVRIAAQDVFRMFDETARK